MKTNLMTVCAVLLVSGCGGDPSETSTTTSVTTTETGVTTETGSTTTNLGELNTGYISLCTDLLPSEKTDSVQLTGTVLSTGSSTDKGAPGELCSWATQYVSFTDSKGGPPHYLGWKVIDTTGADIGPGLQVNAKDVIDIRFSQMVIGYTFHLGFAIVDAGGEMLMTLSGGEALLAADIAPLSVEPAATPYGNGSVPCGWADAYALTFSTDTDSLTLEIGQSGYLTVGNTKLVAHSLSSYILTYSYCSDNDESPTDWGVWRE